MIFRFRLLLSIIKMSEIGRWSEELEAPDAMSSRKTNQ